MIHLYLNFNLVSQNTNISRHGGLAIYLHKKYDFNIINIRNDSEIWEGQFIEIPASKNNKPITLINIYKPPKENTSVNIDTFKTEISPTLQALTDSKPNIIISGDFNIDLLKINEKRSHCDFLQMDYFQLLHCLQGLVNIVAHLLTIFSHLSMHALHHLEFCSQKFQIIFLVLPHLI